MSAAKKQQAVPRVSRAERVHELWENEREDKNETINAMRLQALAWRITACIAVDDPALGRRLARGLIFQTVPWVDGAWVQEFIDKYFGAAKASSVFDARATIAKARGAAP